jgi:LCP family protein required for cell wall assembly
VPDAGGGSGTGDDRPAKRRALLAGKVLTVTAAALVFLITATGWVGTELLDAQLREVSALDPDSDAVTDRAGQLGDQNFLIVGSDTRAGAQPGDGVGTPAAVGGARADTIMIAHLPADRSRVVVVSIPRDVQVSRPRCEEWDPRSGTYTGEFDPGAEISKINAAYAVGGPRCLTRVVQELSGLNINHFLAIDFQGFKAMVDAVDGVRVCVERPLRDRELGTIIPQEGYTTISGDTALDFVRARKVVGDPTADYGRIIRQQRFLSALLRETLSADVLLSPGTLRDVARAVVSNTVGDNIDVATLLRLAQSLQGLDPAAVTLVTVPTTGQANEYGNEVLRPDDTAALFRAIIDGTPLPGEQPPARSANSATPPQGGPSTTPDTTAPPPPLIAPSDVRVRVLNGSGITGQAATGARALREVGFGIVEVSNAESQVESTVIRHAPRREAAARTLAAAVPEATLELDPERSGSLVLVLGPDFGGTVTEVPEPDAAPSLPTDLRTVNGADTACG